MHLGQRCTSPIGRYDGRSVSELLTEIGAEVKGRQASQIREWVAITAWADHNVVDTAEGAATLVEGVIDTGVPIAGVGAPLVSEFNLMELIATLGRTPDGGRAYVGRVIECAWRLHGVYAAVLEGRLPPWKAERIADLTRSLNQEAAAFVDRHLANVRDPGWAQIERLVRDAIIRFDPEGTEADRQAAADHRHFDLSETMSTGSSTSTDSWIPRTGTTSRRRSPAAQRCVVASATTLRSTYAVPKQLASSPARTSPSTCSSPTRTPARSSPSRRGARWS